MKIITTSVLVLWIAGISFGAPFDSVKVKTRKSSPIRVTMRMHSMGLFSFGGRLVSQNPVVDININYNRKAWGLQVFKAVDMNDGKSPINFTLAVVNKTFHIGKAVTITPSVGAIFEQYESVADHGSDVVAIVATAVKLNKYYTVEHTALFGNLVLEPEMRDWVNRLRLMYSSGHFDVTLFGWHNNSVFDSSEYVTTGASIFYSRLKLADRVAMQAGVTGLVMAYSSDEAAVAKANGVFVTLGFVVN